MKYYENMIELHDNRTFWKLDNKTITEDNTDEIEFFLHNLLLDYFKMFEDKTGVELYAEGRSGRHICVIDNEYNRKHYRGFTTLALKLEKQFIKEFNGIDFNKEEK